MRNLMAVGLILIVLGIAGLIIQNVHYTEQKKVLDLGPLQVNSEEQHTVPIPTIIGVGAVIAGLGLVLVSRRSA